MPIFFEKIKHVLKLKTASLCPRAGNQVLHHLLDRVSPRLLLGSTALPFGAGKPKVTDLLSLAGFPIERSYFYSFWKVLMASVWSLCRWMMIVDTRSAGVGLQEKLSSWCNSLQTLFSLVMHVALGLESSWILTWNKQHTFKCPSQTLMQLLCWIALLC